MPRPPAVDSTRGKAKAAPTQRVMPLRKRPLEHAERLHGSSQDFGTRYLEQLDSIPMSNVREQPNTRSDKPDSKRRLIGEGVTFQKLGLAAPVPSKRLNHLADLSPPPEDAAIDEPTSEHDATSPMLLSPASHLSPPSHTSAPSTTPATPAPSVPSPRPSPTTASASAPTITPAPAPAPAPARPIPIRGIRQISSGEHRRGPEYAYPREALKTPLTQDEPLDDQIVLTSKGMEKEYWRRQRRVFVRSRFITMEEATYVANSVYRHQNIEPTHRMVVTFQANIANFRSKWRKILKDVVPTLDITKEDLADIDACEERIRDMLDESMLEWIWGHWIANPFVDRQAFYNNQEARETLTLVTAKALLVTLRHHHQLLRQRDFRKELDDLDRYTRTIYLPDPQP